MTKSALNRILCALLVAAPAAAARAQEVVAVLGSDQRPYREAYDSFQAAYGKPVPILPLGETLPADAKIVLAIGGKAAVQRYPRRVVLIYAIAPGLVVGRRTHDGPSIKIRMEPDAVALLKALATIQPKLRRLAVLWSSASHAASAERLAKAGAARGIEVSAERLEDAEDLPSRLRELKGKADAFWLPPDPLLITAGNFEIIKRFSYDNDVPFYAPAEGLAAQGATAAVSVSYEEIGRMMAASAKGVLGGSASPADLYTDRVRVSVNRAAATEADLTVPPEALKAADKVFP